MEGHVLAGLMSRTIVPEFPEIGLDLTPSSPLRRRIQWERVQPRPAAHDSGGGDHQPATHTGANRLERVREETTDARRASRNTASPAAVKRYSRRPGRFSRAGIAGSSQRLSSSPMFSSRPSARYSVP